MKILKMNLSVWLVIVPLFSVMMSDAHDISRHDTVSMGSLFGIISSDGKEFVQRTVCHFQKAIPPAKSTLLTTGIVAVSTASLFLVDQSVKAFAVQNHSPVNDDVLNIAEKYGATGNALLVSSSVYCAGLIIGSSDIRKTGSLLFESLLWTGVTTSVIKCVLGRSRPYTNEGNMRFHGFQFTDEYLSLPSGHSAVAFALSSVLSERTQNMAPSIGFYSLASLTAKARVYHDEHWFSDVFLGAAIGTSIGIAVARAYKNDPNCSSLHIYVIPTGFQLVLEF